MQSTSYRINHQDTPDDLKRYTRVEMALDIEGLLDHLNIPQVYAVGHDWGSLVVQRLAAVSPSRIKKMVLMSIPFAPPARVKHSIDSLVEKGYDKLKYQLLWRDDETIRRLDSSEDLLKSFFASLFSLPDEKAVRPDGYEWQQLGSEKWAREIHPQTAHQSSLLGKAYLWHVSQFRKYGMRGPCSQYKVWELNTELELELPVQVKTPFLQIIFNGEATLNEDQKRKAVEASNDHVKTMLVEDGKTHWYILEKPDLISKHLLEYVGGTKSSL